jgi:hypothetical protein
MLFLVSNLLWLVAMVMRSNSVGLTLPEARSHADNTRTVFVGFMPSQSSVIVAHQGTDPTKLYVSGATILASYLSTVKACPT